MQKRKCPICEGHIIETREEETFIYGIDEGEFTVIVPVMSCRHCEFSYTDYRGEEIKDQKSLEYLEKSMTPKLKI